MFYTIDLHPELLRLTPFQLWQEIFTFEMFEMFTKQTNLYAYRDCNNPNWHVRMKEMEQFLGTLLLSEYHCFSEEHRYGSTQENLSVSIASKSISRNCFYLIKKYFYVEDNIILNQETK